MSTFVAIEYDDPHKAQEVRLALAKLQKEYLIDLEDAVVAVKDDCVILLDGMGVRDAESRAPVTPRREM